MAQGLAALGLLMTTTPALGGDEIGCGVVCGTDGRKRASNGWFARGRGWFSSGFRLLPIAGLGISSGIEYPVAVVQEVTAIPRGLLRAVLGGCAGVAQRLRLFRAALET